jgi:hypothetical protein
MFVQTVLPQTGTLLTLGSTSALDFEFGASLTGFGRSLILIQVALACNSTGLVVPD